MTLEQLTRLGRTRLSANFFMRDFLYSEIAAVHGLANVPSDPALAVEVGARLCEEVLEPLQAAFGRITIRSAYRSAEVNALGHKLTMSGRTAYACASNSNNAAHHIWDLRDAAGHIGAAACVVVPSFWARYRAEGDWQRLAWWIHDHLPYSYLTFFKTRFAFNIGWHEQPTRIIDSRAKPIGVLTKRGMANHEGSHAEVWEGIVPSKAGNLNSRAPSASGR